MEHDAGDQTARPNGDEADHQPDAEGRKRLLEHPVSDGEEQAADHQCGRGAAQMSQARQDETAKSELFADGRHQRDDQQHLPPRRLLDRVDQRLHRTHHFFVGRVHDLDLLRHQDHGGVQTHRQQQRGRNARPSHPFQQQHARWTFGQHHGHDQSRSRDQSQLRGNNRPAHPEPIRGRADVEAAEKGDDQYHESASQ